MDLFIVFLTLTEGEQGGYTNPLHTRTVRGEEEQLDLPA